MRSRLFWSLGLVLVGWVSGVFGADAKSKDSYSIHPSSQTIKRREAALALGQATDVSQAGPQLVQALGDKDPMTRTLAIQSLGSLKYTAARQKISELLASDRNAEVREAAAVGLRDLGDPQAVGALIKALKDPSMDVRVTALMGIGRFRDAKARLAVEAASHDKTPEVRRTALYVLGRLEEAASIPTVLPLLKDSDPTVRAGAAQALAELHAAEAKPALAGLLKDTDAGVQASAARSLLMLGDNAGFETAASLMKDKNIAVRLLAIDALGWSKDPEAEAQLQALMTQAPADSRVAVQEALRRTQQLRKR